MTTELVGRPRYRVRFWQHEPGVGRVQWVETLAGKAPVHLPETLGGVLVFGDQKDGTQHVVSTVLIKDVVIEQTDHYGDWHQTGTWEWDENAERSETP